MSGKNTKNVRRPRVRTATPSPPLSGADLPENQEQQANSSIQAPDGDAAQALQLSLIMVTPEIVAKFPGFAVLPHPELQRVATRAVRRRVSKGEILFREGDPATCLTLVQQGQIKILKHGPSDRGALIEVAGPWTVLGEAAVYDGGRHHVSAVALTDSVVVQLPVHDAISVLASNPETLLPVLGSLSDHVRRLTERAADLGEAGVERRLAQALCRLCGRSCGGEPPTAGTPVDISIPLTRQDMADMVGTSVETAIRILSKWSRKGMVRSTKDGLQVRDCEALRTVITSPPRSGAHKPGEEA
jgi:CRP-like cAMP-binding protein